MKQVLLLTDFSENAWNAVFTARKLFSRQPCHFIILNCYTAKLENVSGFKSSARTGHALSGLKKASEEGLANVLSVLNRTSSNDPHTFSTISVQADLVSQIKQLIPEYDLDLIVMGAKGFTASRQIFMGSNTVAVIRKIRNCVVLCVPEEFNFQSLKQIVFPTDFTNFYSKSLLNLLLELIDNWKSELSVVHFAGEFSLTAPQKANKKVLVERLINVNYDIFQVQIDTSLSKAITKYAEDKLADMICLVHYEHTFLEQLTREPAIKKVAFNSRVPLLVMPD